MQVSNHGRMVTADATWDAATAGKSGNHAYQARLVTDSDSGQPLIVEQTIPDARTTNHVALQLTAAQAKQLNASSSANLAVSQLYGSSSDPAAKYTEAHATSVPLQRSGAGAASTYSAGTPAQYVQADGAQSAQLQVPGADLRNVDFSGGCPNQPVRAPSVDLRGSSFHGCTFLPGSVFKNALFSGADLSNTTWQQVNAAGAQFAAQGGYGIANLNAAAFTQQTNISNADLAGINFGTVKFDSGVNLSGISVANAVLGWSSLRGVTMQRVDFTKASQAGLGVGSVDFTNSDLTGSDFHGLNVTTNSKYAPAGSFQQANLSGADLSGTTISDQFNTNRWMQTNLSNAKFKNTDLSNNGFVMTNFSGADLSVANGVKLGRDYAPYSNFQGASLAGQDLSNNSNYFIESNWQGANLTGVNLSGLNLALSNFSSTTLPKSLSGVNFINANLSRSNIAGADLSGAMLGGASMQYVTANNVDFTKLVGDSGKAPLDHVDLTGANLTGANLKGMNLQSGTTLTGAIMHNIDLSGMDLRGMNLQGADFSYGTLTGTVFDSANLTKANLTSTHANSAHFDNATLIDAIMVNVAANTASFTKANLTGANLTGAQLVDTTLLGGTATGLSNQAECADTTWYDGSIKNAACTP